MMVQCEVCERDVDYLDAEYVDAFDGCRVALCPECAEAEGLDPDRNDH